MSSLTGRPIIQKTGNIRRKKTMQASRDRSCVKCGRKDGTIVRAHYCGVRQHLYGKGGSIKGHDLIAADLCVACHAEMDQYSSDNSIERSEEFLHLCMLTLVRDFQQGVIK